MNQAQRECGNCLHKHKRSCRHPLAKDQWGRLAGMYRYLPDGIPIWPPVADDEWCGWWRPAEAASEEAS